MPFRRFIPYGTLIVITLVALNFHIRTLQAQEDVAAGEPLTLVWQSEFTPETAIPSPGDIAVDEWGNVYASSQVDNTIKLVIAIAAALVVIALITYARGIVHHHGDEVGALSATSYLA